MCGRVVWIWDAETGTLVKTFDEQALTDPNIRHVLEKQRYNVPPSSHLPVILGTSEGTKVQVRRWGFPIPQRPNGVFNTRSETAGQSPMWRSMLGSTHCVFPVRGFYEWKRKGRTKTPLYFHRKDGRNLLLAGLYGWRTVAGEKALCASILTCAPNTLMEPVHDRMPVILEAEDARPWLEASPQSVSLLAPAGSILEAYEVSPTVNSTQNDEASLIRPLRESKWF